LIKVQKDNRQDDSIADQLETFANPTNLRYLKTRRNYGVYILGIFKANRTRLNATVNNHFDARTKPISDGILKEIRSKLDDRYKDLIDLQAYAGQRIHALATIPIQQIDITHPKYAIINIHTQQNKTRQEHFSIVPKELMQRIITRCKQLNTNTPFPNYEELWKSLTKYANEYYDVKLTSHYLRKRFATIASDTPMDVNQWDYLMGTKKSKGHTNRFSDSKIC
jgi:Phage integrase family